MSALNNAIEFLDEKQNFSNNLTKSEKNYQAGLAYLKSLKQEQKQIDVQIASLNATSESNEQAYQTLIKTPASDQKEHLKAINKLCSKIGAVSDQIAAAQLQRKKLADQINEYSAALRILSESIETSTAKVKAAGKQADPIAQKIVVQTAVYMLAGQVAPAAQVSPAPSNPSQFPGKAHRLSRV